MNLIKNNNDIFYYIDKLPFYLINEIKKYISNKSLIFINREKYINTHYLIRESIPNIKFETYIRNILYRDFDFVFNQIIQENYLNWFQIKNYIYKNVVYKKICNFYLNNLITFQTKIYENKKYQLVFNLENDY